MNSYYLGIDVGSVSTNVVLSDYADNVIKKLYLRTNGQPINSIKTGIEKILDGFDKHGEILAVGSTGSGRGLADLIIGCDVVKNEITAHAIAAQKSVPNVRTILEIGGQDSKLILLKNGAVHDFAMNTVCAAGTGSFLDRQAERLGIPIQEFGDFALRAKSSVRIAGRCAVFAESDMIHKQQAGCSKEDILKGLCTALVRNFINNLGKGKKIERPIVFQGGVAANKGIIEAFREELGEEIIIPEHHDVMGAYGSALLAKEKEQNLKSTTKFKGFEVFKKTYDTDNKECNGCSNLCELIEIKSEGKRVALMGDRCGKWSAAMA